MKFGDQEYTEKIIIWIALSLIITAGVLIPIYFLWSCNPSGLSPLSSSPYIENLSIPTSVPTVSTSSLSNSTTGTTGTSTGTSGTSTGTSGTSTSTSGTSTSTSTGTATTTSGTFYNDLLKTNMDQQDLLQKIIDPATGDVKVNKIVLGDKTIDENSFSTQSGWALHGDIIKPPSGNTDNWTIMVAPRTNFGQEEPGSEADNALLKFECFANAKTDKTGWQITGRYKYRNKNGDGIWKTDTKTSYILISR